MAAIEHYANFDLLLSRGGGDAYQVRVLAAPAGGATAAPVAAPAAELHALDAAIAAWRDLALDRSAARRLGADLMAWLFRGPVMQLYRTSLPRDATADGLRIRLRIEPAELHIIPWELCYDAETGSFLAQDARTPLVRYLLGTFTRGRLAGGRLRVCVAMAAPAGLTPLDAATECARIADALAGRGAAQPMTASLDDLQDALRQGPHVLHFIGHGGFDADTGGYLVMDDGRGGPQMADAEVLASYLRGSSVRLAVLNACESARTDPADSFAGVAPRLVQAGLPAVVAMQTFLPDAAAAVFSGAFYRALADGRPVDAAVAAGRVALFGHAPARADWSIPALYLAADDGIIWEAAPPADSAPGAGPSAPSASPASSFQFNFQGPVTINAEVMGGNKYVTTTSEERARSETGPSDGGN
jgi:hypothetical protein